MRGPMTIIFPAKTQTPADARSSAPLGAGNVTLATPNLPVGILWGHGVHPGNWPVTSLQMECFGNRCKKIKT